MANYSLKFGTKERFVFTKSIIGVIQSVGGYIFGGAVRDSIRHDIIAEEFYQCCNQTDEDGDAMRRLFAETYEDIEFFHDPAFYPENLYQDPTYLPHLSDRFLVPNDIDCFMSSNSLEKLKSKFDKNSDFRMRTMFQRSLGVYMSDIKPSAVGLLITRLVLTPRVRGILGGMISIIGDKSFYIDVIHKDVIKGIYPPFGNIDFECNSLLLTPTNDYMLSPHLTSKMFLSPRQKLDKLQDIMDDIKDKRAVIVERVPFHRASKMMEKSWEVAYYKDDYRYVDTNATLVLTQKPIVDSNCSICLGEFEQGEYKMMRSCCKSGVYHPKCWGYFLKSNATKQCPMCRSDLEAFEVSNEKTVDLWG